MGGKVVFSETEAFCYASSEELLRNKKLIVGDLKPVQERDIDFLPQ